MSEIYDFLINVLSINCPIHKQRIRLIAQLVLAVIKTNTVNLSKLAFEITGGTLYSRYRKLQKFFQKFTFDQVNVANTIISIIKQREGPWDIILDRTNWKVGKCDINVLMLSIASEGATFPLFWRELDKQGNSNTAERIALVELFIQNFGVERINYLIADREFIGDDWLKWLKTNNIKFCIRIKENIQIGRASHELTTANYRLKSLAKGEYTILEQERVLGQSARGVKANIVALRNEENELVVLAVNGDPKNAIQIYKRRWGIETLFGFLKTRGFNLESTHITDLRKIHTLISILAISFALTYVTGEWLNGITPIKTKNYREKDKIIKKKVNRSLDMV